MRNKLKNCAIYCRKSSDEGLDMDFNSLDAQRESCESYISSQKSQGWKTIKARYDDGGFSGGNMDRPALRQILDDIKNNKIDIVVVYKIDRLTRSLMDFAKLVEIFDRHNVTFVSVTQSFNTTTSMGRLTLNVLLSFAQFEREVCAERIRDKFAASKKKGMWMGGVPPVGYEVKNRKLIINKEGEKITKSLFNQYLELGCVAKLKKYLDESGITTQKRLSQNGKKMGGKPYSRGALYSILKNPIYIGKTKHKDNVYDGQHDAIIDKATWNSVQEKLNNQAIAKQGHRKSREGNLLKGLLFDCEGTSYSPDYTKKKTGQVYRYYTSQNLIQYRDHPKGIMSRIPALEIEKTICNTIAQNITDFLKLNIIDDHKVIEHIHACNIKAEGLVRTCINRIDVNERSLKINVNIRQLRKVVKDHIDYEIPKRLTKQSHTLAVPFSIRRADKGAILIKPDNDEPSISDLPPTQLKNLIRGIVWRDEHFAGQSLISIAERENLSEAGVRKIIMGSFDTLLSL